MNRRQKKIRARRRAQAWEAEKVLDALVHGPRYGGGVLRHGKTVTFYKEDGKPAVYGSLEDA